jgi:hypothetical protein
MLLGRRRWTRSLVRPSVEDKDGSRAPGQGKAYQAGRLGSTAEVMDGGRIRQGPTLKIYRRSMPDLQNKVSTSHHSSPPLRTLWTRLVIHLHSMRRSTGGPAGSDSTRRRIVPKKTMEKASKLVEVIRAGYVNILFDLYFSAFWDRRYTKDDNRNVPTEGAFLAYPVGGCEELVKFEAQAHQDQIRRL